MKIRQIDITTSATSPPLITVRESPDTNLYSLELIAPEAKCYLSDTEVTELIEALEMLRVPRQPTTFFNTIVPTIRNQDNSGDTAQ